MSDSPVPSRTAVLATLAVLLTGLLAGVLVACSPEGGGQASAGSGGTVTVVDVRTAGEHASGHVPGARNVDVESPGFAAEVAALSPDESYLVYCRSGNRSARATEIMRAAGLTVEDGGGLADMAAAGYELTG